MIKPKVLFLVGPTAIGKTAVALRLAAKIDAEIISCDSMQVYKGMDILTSKPAERERRHIPHHLIDIISPDKEYNVSRYRLAAVRKINELAKMGKAAFFVGGSGLYMSVVIDGIFKAKTENPLIRERLYQESQQFGSPYIYGKLKKVDPNAAQNIHPNDTKRIIRALEVFESTGKRISLLQAARKGITHKYDVQILGLRMPREELCRRIDRRVDKMFAKGLVKEVKKLLRLELSRTAKSAIGLAEIKGYIDGLYDVEEAKSRMQIKTRQYAKRQMTWFRKDKRIIWTDITDEESPAKIMGKLWKKLYW